MPIMPKKTTDKTADVALARKMIRAYCTDQSISINKLSQCIGVNQSALFRFVNGERRSLTKTAKKAMEYVKKGSKWHNSQVDFSDAVPDSEGYRIIEDAVLSCWDGSRRSAELLADVIKALSPIVAMVSKAPGENRKGMDL